MALIFIRLSSVIFVLFKCLCFCLCVCHCLQHGVGHPGNKGSHVVFLGDMNVLFSTGFSRMNERQIALWDVVRNSPFEPIPKAE